MDLPLNVEQLTPEWLTRALSARSPGTEVESVEVESVIWGTASKVFLRVGYRTRDDQGPPEHLCVKGCFSDDMRAIAGVGCRLEAGFYRDIAPGLGVPLPTIWFADTDEDADQGIVVFDDLREGDTSFSRAGQHYTPDEVAAGLELQATWHARTWDRTGPATTPWLAVGSPFFRHAMAGLFHTPAHWDRMLTLPQTASLTDELRMRERVVAAMHRQWALDDADVQCLSHGDCHIGNTYRVAGEPAPRFLDWQVFGLGPWVVDVAYFLVGSLTVSDRRNHEEALLRHYLEVLAGRLGERKAPTFDEAMASVRRHHLHGVMWAFCPPEMQDPDGCAEMARRHVAAALDHDTLGALARR